MMTERQCFGSQVICRWMTSRFKFDDAEAGALGRWVFQPSHCRPLTVRPKARKKEHHIEDFGMSDILVPG
jgi:hypothetical protein